MEKTVVQDQPDTAGSLNNVDSKNVDPGDHQKALEYHQQALKISEETLGHDHPDTASSLNNIGSTYVKLGDYNKALEYHERAFYILKKVLGPEDPTMLSLLDNFMTVCIRAKKITKAYNVLNAYIKELPKDHPEYAYLVSFKSRINKEGTQTGFRSPSAQNRNKQKKKRRKKK